MIRWLAPLFLAGCSSAATAPAASPANVRTFEVEMVDLGSAGRKNLHDRVWIRLVEGQTGRARVTGESGRYAVELRYDAGDRVSIDLSRVQNEGTEQRTKTSIVLAPGERRVVSRWVHGAEETELALIAR